MDVDEDPRALPERKEPENEDDQPDGGESEAEPADADPVAESALDSRASPAAAFQRTPANRQGSPPLCLSFSPSPEKYVAQTFSMCWR